MKSNLEALPHQPHFLFSPFLHFLIAHGPIERKLTCNLTSENIITYFQFDLFFYLIKKDPTYCKMILKRGKKDYLRMCLTTETSGVTLGAVILRLWSYQMLSGLKIQMSAACSAWRRKVRRCCVTRGYQSCQGLQHGWAACMPSTLLLQRSLQWGWALCLPQCFSGLFPFHCTVHSTDQCLIISSSIQLSFFIKCCFFIWDMFCRCWLSD